MKVRVIVQRAISVFFLTLATRAHGRAIQESVSALNVCAEVTQKPRYDVWIWIIKQAALRWQAKGVASDER